MRPIFAADRLKVLRRQNENYEIMLFESDLLKAHVPKDKRIELVKGLTEDELV
jgi:hypothetical protein